MPLWNKFPAKKPKPQPEAPAPVKPKEVKVSNQQIFEQSYWRDRLNDAVSSGELHKAVFRVGLDKWEEICKLHQATLARVIRPGDHVLDVACGWGRMLGLMPKEWLEENGRYHGVDLSEAFIERAKLLYGEYSQVTFAIHDLRNLLPENLGRFDVAIVAGTRTMIQGQAGEAVWDQIEANVAKVCDTILFLEYDTDERLMEIKQCRV